MSSSDLELARALSRLLAPPAASAPSAGGSPAVEAPDASRYVRLVPGPARPGVVAPSPAVPVPPVPAPAPRMAPDVPETRDWSPLLEWLLKASGCRTAFLADAHGRIVGSAGPADEEELQARSARLAVALDQARLLSPEAASLPFLAMHVGGDVLTGFPVPLSDGTSLNVGLVGATAASTAVRDALASSLRAG